MIPNYDRSLAPRYVQVAAAVRRRIEDGEWKPGDRLPTLEELEAEFQVARVTVRQAMEILQKEGMIRRVQGKGTFVHGALEDRRWLVLDLHWDGLVKTIGANVPRLIGAAEPAPPPVLREDEGTPAGAYMQIDSVQSRAGQPFGVARVHVARALFERAPERFGREPAIVVIDGLPAVGISQARQTFTIASADTRIAELLKVGIGFPTVEARLVVTDSAGVVIYLGLISYRGDCVRLDVDLLSRRNAPASGARVRVVR